MSKLINSTLLNPERILRKDFEIVAGDKVADLGCGGSGHFTITAAHIATSTGQVHAVDIIKRALTVIEGRAKTENLNNIKTYWSDLERFGALKIHDNSLDKIVLTNTLFQSKNPEAILKETIRLLKPKGSLLVIDWLPGRFYIGPSAEKKINKITTEKHANELGLSKIKEFSPGEYHFGLIFQKTIT